MDQGCNLMIAGSDSLSLLMDIGAHAEEAWSMLPEDEPRETGAKLSERPLDPLSLSSGTDRGGREAGQGLLGRRPLLLDGRRGDGDTTGNPCLDNFRGGLGIMWIYRCSQSLVHQNLTQPN